MAQIGGLSNGRNKGALLALMLAGAAGLLLARTPPPTKLAVPIPEVPTPAMGTAQIPFELNRGQAAPEVAFLARTFAGPLEVLRDGRWRYRLAGTDITETPVDAAAPVVSGTEVAVAQVSYYIGRESSRWLSAVPTYTGVSLGEPWPGVRLSLQARGDNVEKIFTLAPGADAGRIRLHSSEAARIDEDGQLQLGALTLSAPIAYQQVDGRRRGVEVAYQLRGGDYGFRLGAYDRDRELVIDPIIRATTLGASAAEAADRVLVDPSSGDVLITGFSRIEGRTVPGTEGGAFPTRVAGALYVARFSGDLKTLKQATYFGGATGLSEPQLTVRSLIRNPADGSIYIAGGTICTDLPGTAGSFQPQHGDAGGNDSVSDAFVARFSADLRSLLRTSYLGTPGYDDAGPLLFNPVNNDLYLAGASSNGQLLPARTGAAQPGSDNGGGADAFLARIKPDLSAVVRTTLHATVSNPDGYGGNAYGSALAVDPVSGDLFLAGLIDATEMPGTAGAFKTSNPRRDPDGFIARFTPDLATRIRASYLGGNGYEDIAKVLVHPDNGDLYLMGPTASDDFPKMAGGLQPSRASGSIAIYLARVKPDLTELKQGTYLGGTNDNAGNALAVLTDGQLLVGGASGSRDFPFISAGVQPNATFGFSVGVLVKINAALTAAGGGTAIYGNNGNNNSPILDVAYDAANDQILAAGSVSVRGDTPDNNFPAGCGYNGRAPASGVSPFVARYASDLSAQPSDTTPDAFGFADQEGVPTSADITSEPYVISGLGPTDYIPITVSNGVYSVNGSAFGNGPNEHFHQVPTLLQNCDVIRLQHRSAATVPGTVTTTLSINGVTGSFTSNTGTSGVQPFEFAPQADAEPDSLVISAPVSIAGPTVPAPISVSDGEYSIDGATFRSDNATVSAGSTVRLRLRSAEAYATEAAATLSVGDQSASFRVTTREADRQPEGFDFLDQTGRERDTLIESNVVTIAGIEAPAPISISGGEYRVIGVGAYGTASGEVAEGQQVQLRLRSAPDFEAMRSASVSIGGVMDSFSVTTRAARSTPDAFSFAHANGVEPGSTPVSNEVTLSGLERPVPIAVSGGRYSLNGGSFTSAAGEVSAGTRVRVNLDASPNYAQSRTATLNVNGAMAGFTATTRGAATTPRQFNFAGRNNVEPDQLYESEVVTPQGLEAPTRISVFNGEYRINQGSYTTTEGALLPGQTVQVRIRSPKLFHTEGLLQLFIGAEPETSVSNGFSVVVRNGDETPNPFQFADKQYVEPSTFIESDEVVIAGLERFARVFAGSPNSTAEYRINDGAWTHEAGTIANGDRLRVRVRSSADARYVESSASVQVGTYTTTFRNFTRCADPAARVDAVFPTVYGQDPVGGDTRSVSRLMCGLPQGALDIRPVTPGCLYQVGSRNPTRNASGISNGEALTLIVQRLSGFAVRTDCEYAIGSQGGVGGIRYRFSAVTSGAVGATVQGPSGALVVTPSIGMIQNLRLVPPPPLGELPPGMSFRTGFLSFEVANIAPGSTVEMRLDVPSTLPLPTGVVKCQTLGGCAVIPSTIVGRQVRFQVTDGGVGDEDGRTDGRISDPFGVAFPGDSTLTATSSGGALGGSALAGLGLLLGWRRRRR